MAANDIWVIDTSSILQVRRVFERTAQDLILDGLSARVEAGVLVFPKEVLTELKRFRNPRKRDRPYE